ncbi:glycosyltransferase [Rhizobiaceae bacterium BDR2-2]|uniref:Glycosyltransferase n=1 Tax=Ectorhizobium quercum TaxID=2965071 RepID=A0AAE3SX55_9HYPH|nr:glycosyltransferase family 2 protein [Ectorhizobium quercum]MCX8998125.1 glycosyltransferase [Ectorhizobium quercum]
MTDPFFSVAIPLYNRAKTIGKTIESVLAQSFSDFEIVVVDDGSVDQPEKAIAAIGDPRIRLIRQPNGGAAVARNRAVSEGRGRYIAFLDSDDFFLPHHLESAAAILKDNPDAVVYSQVLADRGNGRVTVKPPRSIRPGENMASYLVTGAGFVQTSTLVLPRALALAVRYRPDVSFGDDTDYAIRLSLAGTPFVMTEKPGVIWRDEADPDRLSSNNRSIRNPVWLEDLKEKIPASAYEGYRGWHVAKSFMPEHPLKAFKLYVNALRHGAYGPRLAVVVFIQLVLSGTNYRKLADFYIGHVRSRGRHEA